MQGSWVWMLLAVALMLVGFYVLFRGLRQKNDLLEHGDTKFKNGLPITPRDERQFELESTASDTEEDALSNMAEAMQATPISTLQAMEPEKPAQPVMPTEEVPTKEAPTTHEAQIDMAQVDNGFDEAANVLDQHLDEQHSLDEANNPLGECEGTVTIVITPQYGAGLSGRKVLEISRNYGLRHGVMNMFHRHEMEDGRGDLWFSMMAEDGQGPTAFDLNTLADDHFAGLILFLVLPHKQLLRGYDSMVSTANMLARELNAVLTDENRNLMDDESFARLRGILANHQ